VFLFRLLPTVHGRFRLARGFFVGWNAPSAAFYLADEHANRSRGAGVNTLLHSLSDDGFQVR
jgi:hypothetical protein